VLSLLELPSRRNTSSYCGWESICEFQPLWTIITGWAGLGGGEVAILALFEMGILEMLRILGILDVRKEADGAK